MSQAWNRVKGKLTSSKIIVNPDEIGWLNALGGKPSGNYQLPIHRWFRFPAGFSSRFIDVILNRFCRNFGDVPILDPFAGTATSLICGKAANINCIGVEAHPLLYLVGKAKTCWDVDLNEFSSACRYLITRLSSNAARTTCTDSYPPLIIES